MREVDAPDVAQVMAAEVRLFDLRRSARSGQKSQLRERINQANEEIVGFGSQKAAKDKEIGFIENELTGVRELYQKNLVPITRLSQLEREATRLGGERGQLIAATAQARGKIAELQLQIIQVDQDLSSEVAKEMREIDARIGEFIERKVSALDQLKRTDIRAPQDGTVFQSSVHTIGGVIPAGEPIMMIVPDSDRLTVEAKVIPQDIDKVRSGRARHCAFQRSIRARRRRFSGASRRFRPTSPPTSAPTRATIRSALRCRRKRSPASAMSGSCRECRSRPSSKRASAR